MSRLAALLRSASVGSPSLAALRLSPASSSSSSSSSPFRRFSTDTSGAGAGAPGGEAAAAAAGAPGGEASAAAEAPGGEAPADSPDHSFQSSVPAYGRFYSPLHGNGLPKHMLKTDVLHWLDKCRLSMEDVKMDYNKGFRLMGALVRFPSRASYDTATRKAIQSRVYRIEMLSQSEWDLKQSYDGKSVLLQGVPRNAFLEDIERFLSGTNFEASQFENFLIPGDMNPTRVVLVRFPSSTDAMNAFISKNRAFCLNNAVGMRVLQ